MTATGFSLAELRAAYTALQNGTFADLAYSPARESLLAEADPVVEEGLQVLRDLNARRNEIAARG